MRKIIATIAVFAAFGSYPAFSDEAARQEPVRIEIDQQSKAFIFIIDDEPVAMLDKNGLHVVGSVEYGGHLTDTGPDWIKDKIASRGKESADD